VAPEDDTLVSRDGVVHEKGPDGQYRPRQGVFGPERDTTWTGRPNVERDWRGQPRTEQEGLFRRPVQARDGEPLYRRAGTGGSAGSSSYGGDGCLYLILAVVVFALGIGFAAVAASPVIAPLLLATAAGARKRRDEPNYQRYARWGITASGWAAVAVILYSLAAGIALTQFLVENVLHSVSSTNEAAAYAVAGGGGLALAIVLGVVSIAPTAIMYMRHREASFRATGQPERAAKSVARRRWLLVAALFAVAVALVICAVASAVGAAVLA